MSAKKKPVELPNELIAQIIAIRIDTDITEFLQPSFVGHVIRDCPRCQNFYHLNIGKAILEAIPEFLPTVAAVVKERYHELVAESDEVEKARAAHKEVCVNWLRNPWGEYVFDKNNPECVTCENLWTRRSRSRAGECKWTLEALVKCLERS